MSGVRVCDAVEARAGVFTWWGCSRGWWGAIQTIAQSMDTVPDMSVTSEPRSSRGSPNSPAQLRLRSTTSYLDF